MNCGFADASAVFIDSTHIKACVNNKKYTNEIVKIEAKHYQKELTDEINKDRSEHDKKTLKEKDDDDAPPTKNIKQSTTDPESGLFHKGEHKVVFAYTAHTACDKHKFILGVDISARNVHDSVMFDGIYKNVMAKFPVNRGNTFLRKGLSLMGRKQFINERVKHCKNGERSTSVIFHLC